MRRIRLGRSPDPLPPEIPIIKEFEFFKILALNAGRIVTQSQILKEIWGPNMEQNSHYLRVYVAQLRKKVEEPLGRKIIITEAGIGYRLLL